MCYMEFIRISRHKLRKIKRKRNRLSYQVKQKYKGRGFVYGLFLVWAYIIDGLFWFCRMFCKLSFLSVVGFVLFLVFFRYSKISFLSGYYEKAMELADKSVADDFSINEGSVIYDNKGEVLANLYDTRFTTYLSYEDIPKDVVNAFVSIEDRSFWTNDGVDYKGIVRVLYRYVVTKGEESHGASTITQQLARSIYLTRETTLSRKITEIFLARELTNSYSKEMIMEFYVNTCNYGNGIYGIEGAANAYFNKSAKELTIAEVAYLCAIPNRPSYYNPWEDVNNAIPRQKKILYDMLQLGCITTADYEAALRQKIVLEDMEYAYNDYLSTYAIDCAVRYLMKLDNYAFRYEFESMDDYKNYKAQYELDYKDYKHKLYTGGYRIYTSLDRDVYANLQDIFDSILASYNNELTEDGTYALQGGMTVIDNETHKVIALVGGRSQEHDTRVYSFNRAYQAYRQPGSSIKPLIVYTPALECGWNPNSKVYNIDVSLAKEPGVDVQTLRGQEMTLRSAVEQSKNGVAWQLFDAIGPKSGLSYLQKQQFQRICPDDYHNAASLGGLTYGASTVEMASAYATLANDGVYYEPTCILSFCDKSGRDMFEGDTSLRVYTKKASVTIRDICAGVLTDGTAKNLDWSSFSDMPVFAKTGTTNGSKDIWFCGSTPYYSIAVYVGFDTPREMPGLYGSSYSGMLWRDSMLSLIKEKPIVSFANKNKKR